MLLFFMSLEKKNKHIIIKKNKLQRPCNKGKWKHFKITVTTVDSIYYREQYQSQKQTKHNYSTGTAIYLHISLHSSFLYQIPLQNHMSFFSSSYLLWLLFWFLLSMVLSFVLIEWENERKETYSICYEVSQRTWGFEGYEMRWLKDILRIFVYLDLRFVINDFALTSPFSWLLCNAFFRKSVSEKLLDGCYSCRAEALPC